MPLRPMLTPVDMCTAARGAVAKVARHLADGRGVDADDRGDHVGRVAGDEAAQFVDVLAVLVDAPVESDRHVDLVDQRGEQEDVGVGKDLQGLAGLARRPTPCVEG